MAGQAAVLIVGGGGSRLCGEGRGRSCSSARQRSRCSSGSRPGRATRTGGPGDLRRELEVLRAMTGCAQGHDLLRRRKPRAADRRIGEPRGDRYEMVCPRAMTPLATDAPVGGRRTRPLGRGAGAGRVALHAPPDSVAGQRPAEVFRAVLGRHQVPRGHVPDAPAAVVGEPQLARAPAASCPTSVTATSPEPNAYSTTVRMSLSRSVVSHWRRPPSRLRT